ncbi:MAG: hypothetical protein KGM16_00155 [Bacteroidota bacterium]|nr:hypothetical protein [Bacteroidota bacterium]
MEKERKIKAVVKKVTFAEAENADDEYWSQASVEERLQELVDLRRIFFGDAENRIKKIISRRSIYDEEN